MSSEKEFDEFKNFHRNVCKVVGYSHDEKDWKRDQASLCEFMKSKLEEKDKEIERLKADIEKYIALTRSLDEHPEDFDEWCECRDCQSVAAGDCDFSEVESE